MGLSLINSDTLNAYTGTFQVLAFGNMWRRFKSVSVALRVVPFISSWPSASSSHSSATSSS